MRTTRLRSLPSVLCLLSSVLCFAVPATAKVTALVGGRLIDGWGGAPVNNSVVLIEGERAARRCDSAFGYRCHLRILRPSRAVEVALLAAGLDGYLDIAEGADRQPAA